MNKRNIIIAFSILLVALTTVALVINPALSVTAGPFVISVAPAFFGFALLFLLGTLVEAMVRES